MGDVWSPSPLRGTSMKPKPNKRLKIRFQTEVSHHLFLPLLLSPPEQKLQTLSESRVSSSRRSLSSHNQILETLLFESGIVLRFRYVFSIFFSMKIRFELFCWWSFGFAAGFKKRILLWILSEYENSKIDTLYSH